ncbi:RNA polymerase sigma-70 factor [soil metagenome]
MHNLKEYDDHSLLLLLQQGDERAFEILYLRYWDKLLSVCHHWLKSEEIAKEMVQDVFVNLWAKREKITIYKSFKSYLFTSVKYRIFDHIDAENIRLKFSEESKMLNRDIDNSTEEKLSFDEVYFLVENEVQKLPKKSKAVFDLRRENHSVKEIAELLNISQKTVEYHISKANKQLKNNLGDLVTMASFIYLVF